MTSIDPDGLFDLALADPAAARIAATAVLVQPLVPDDDLARVLRARGLAHRSLGNLDESLEDLERALQLSASNVPLRVACALTLGATHMYRGEVDQAQAAFLDALVNSRGLARGEALLQLGTSYIHEGRPREALDLYREALPILRRHGRRDWVADLLTNRGYALNSLGEFGAAERDIRQALEIFVDIGSDSGQAISEQNLGLVMFARGNLVEALRVLFDAAEVLVADGMPAPMAFAERSQALLAAGFFFEAQRVATEAAAFCRSNGNVAGFVENATIAAEAALAGGDHEVVLRIARDVDGTNGTANFPGWFARLELAALQAQHGQAESMLEPEDIVRRARHLREAGQPTAGLEALLLAAEVFAEQGRPQRALELAGEASPMLRRSSLTLQLYRWVVIAKARFADGDTGQALRSVRRGLQSAEALHAAVGSFEVRAHASQHVAVLAEMGASALMARGRLADTVELCQVVRSSALHHSPWPESERGAMRKALTELREAEEISRRVDAPRSAQETLLFHQRRVASMSRSRSSAQQIERSTVRQLHSDEVLLTFVEVEEQVVGLVSTRDRVIVESSTPRSRCIAAASELGFVARQFSRRRQLSERAYTSLLDQFRSVTNELDDALLPRFAPDVRVLINPSRSLQGVPFGSLPSLFSRVHCITPSIEFASRALATTQVVVAGSSELSHVPVEMRAVSRAHGVSYRIDPTSDLVDDLHGAGTAHVAGHFKRSGTNPLFSNVDLGGFQLHGYDILNLGAPPSVLVLSACSTADALQVGSTAIGFATAALAGGTSSIVVSESLVEDADTIVSFMGDLHSRLAAGDGPAEALATVRSHLDSEDHPLGGTFSVLGTGWSA